MFDIEFLVPVCGRFAGRLADFKKYGLVNLGARSVLLNLLVSGETVSGLADGWPSGVSVRVLEYRSPNFIGNLYRFYADLKHEGLQSRWLARVDDDSFTDVDGLVSNLDEFYDHDRPYYLGDLNNFHAAKSYGEGGPYGMYRASLGRLDFISDHVQNEIECGIMSVSALKMVLMNQASIDLLRLRSEIEGGFGDCVVALASMLAKVWPLKCPFVTHLPLVHEFSLLGGFRNHIHGIAKDFKDRGWPKAGPDSFLLVSKAIDNDPSDIEMKLANRRFLLEGENSMRIVEFAKGYRARVKTDNRSFHWFEKGGRIFLLADGAISDAFDIDKSGNLHCEGLAVTRI